eukprot:PhF_6_TR21165/c0_g1_i1/m.30490
MTSEESIDNTSSTYRSALLASITPNSTTVISLTVQAIQDWMLEVSGERDVMWAGQSSPIPLNSTQPTAPSKRGYNLTEKMTWHLSRLEPFVTPATVTVSGGKSRAEVLRCLEIAAAVGHLQYITQILPTLNVKDKGTCLRLAAQNGHYDIVDLITLSPHQRLLIYNNTIDVAQDSCVTLAAVHNHVEVVKLLASREPLFFRAMPSNAQGIVSALWTLMERGNAAMFKLLFELFTPESLGPHVTFVSMIRKAVSLGKREIIEFIFPFSPDCATVVDRRLGTLLITACTQPDIGTFEFILSRTPRSLVYATNYEGLTCLATAIQHSQLPHVVKLTALFPELLAVQDTKGRTCLHTAVGASASPDVLKHLLQLVPVIGDLFKVQDHALATPFLLASCVGNVDAVRALLEHECTVFPACLWTKNKGGEDALIGALHGEHKEVVRCILRFEEQHLKLKGESSARGVVMPYLQDLMARRADFKYTFTENYYKFSRSIEAVLKEEAEKV